MRKDQLFNAVLHLGGVGIGALVVGKFLGLDGDVTQILGLTSIVVFTLYLIKTKKF